MLTFLQKRNNDMEDQLSDQYTITSVAITCVWACRISGFISLLCSSFLLRIVVLCKNDNTSKNNILGGLSGMDIIQSIAYVASSAPSPAGTWYGSIGNSITCKIQGFMVQVGFGVPCYSASLALFYLLVVGKNYQTDLFAKRIEPFCHIVSIGIPLISAIVLISLNKLGGKGTGVCWVFDAFHPRETYIVALVSGGVIVCICNAFVLFAMGKIVLSIRQRRLAMRRYSFRGREPTVLIDMEKKSLQQGLLFSMAYFFSYAPSALVILLLSFGVWGVNSGGLYNTVVILQNIFLPLHGLWNFVIYARPLVEKVRLRDPSMTISRTIWFLLSSPKEFHESLSHQASRRPSLGA